jgi:uncharacterized protein YjbJ (UPF0337 family)
MPSADSPATNPSSSRGKAEELKGKAQQAFGKAQQKVDDVIDREKH